MTPQEAFYAAKHAMPIEQSAGRDFAASLLCVILPVFQFWLRESVLHKEILDYIAYAKEKGCFLTGTEDIHIENINVVGEN